MVNVTSRRSPADHAVSGAFVPALAPRESDGSYFADYVRLRLSMRKPG